MRKIKVETWKAKGADGKEIEETILNALNLLLIAKKPEEMPRGIDKFRLYSRLSKAFDKAEKEKVLVLEEMDYKFLKDALEKDAPSMWGMNQNIVKAVEDFLAAKEE